MQERSHIKHYWSVKSEWYQSGACADRYSPRGSSSFSSSSSSSCSSNRKPKQTCCWSSEEHTTVPPFVTWAKKLGKQLGQPTRSIPGWLTSKLLIRRNRVLEENAVRLCGIQPGDTVLELGHGPGLGLQSAAKLLTDPTGHLIGVDYSQYMHQMASERMKELVASGKVTLHHCDVAAMPLADSTVDKVFHSNCYYFWPDLRKAASEIHRVIKPGGLMVTTLKVDSVAAFAAKGVLPENWRPEPYMAALRDSGFTDVKMEDKQNNYITFQAIYATALK